MGFGRGPRAEQRSSQYVLDEFQFWRRLCKVLTEEPTDGHWRFALGGSKRMGYPL
jgi:hypothetical protein